MVVPHQISEPRQMQPQWLHAGSSKRLQELIRRAAVAPHPKPSKLGWILGFTEPAAEVAYNASHDPARLAGCALLACLVLMASALRVSRVVGGTNAYPTDTAGAMILGINIITALICSSCPVCYWFRIEMPPTVLRQIAITAHYLLTVANLIRIFRTAVPDTDTGSVAFRAGYWFGFSMGALPVIASLLLKIPVKHVAVSVCAHSIFALALRTAALDVLLVQWMMSGFALWHENMTRAGFLQLIENHRLSTELGERTADAVGTPNPVSCILYPLTFSPHLLYPPSINTSP